MWVTVQGLSSNLNKITSLDPPPLDRINTCELATYLSEFKDLGLSWFLMFDYSLMTVGDQ